MNYGLFLLGAAAGLLLSVFYDQLQRVLLGKFRQYTNPNKPVYQRHPCEKQVDYAPEIKTGTTSVRITGKTGRLVYDGEKNLGYTAYSWWKCVDCLSVYPQIGDYASCNRTQITLCPWCRPDSRPNCHGRGTDG